MEIDDDNFLDIDDNQISSSIFDDMIDKDYISTYFPFDSFRKYQKETLERIVKAFKTKNTVILEAPTGSGKSSYAITLGRLFRNAYVLTSQKLLQDQYTKEFTNGSEIVDLKGKANYKCNLDGKKLNVARCAHKKNLKCDSCRSYISNTDDPFSIKEVETCANTGCYIKLKCKPTCEYTIQLKKAIQSKILILNYSIALLLGGKLLKPRDLLICDEAHNIEEILMGHITFTISPERLEKFNILKPIPQTENIETHYKWISNELLTDIQIQLSEMKYKLEHMDFTSRKFIDLNKIYEDLAKFSDNLEMFISNKNDIEWIATNTKDKAVLFRPLMVSNFTHRFFNLANKKLLMSATILDKESYCRSVGLKDSEVEFIQVPSLFPPENRPITVYTGIKLAKDHLDANLPNLLHAVRSIIDNKHPKEKGIIHTHSYKIAKYLEENLRNDRVLIHNDRNRHDVYLQHVESTKPTILISPSMTEGIDLKNDLSRFQIICKLPFPYLGDKQIMKRKEIDPGWYAWNTCLTLVQSYGRSIRSEKDYAETYILDGSFGWFLKTYDKFPEWFTDAIEDYKPWNSL